MQAVIHNNCVGAIGNSRSRAGGPVVREPGRCLSCKKERLIPHSAGFMPCRVNPHRPACGAAIATGEEVRRHAPFLHELCEGERGWSFPGAASDDIADANHRRFDLLGCDKDASDLPDHGIAPGEWRQKICLGAAVTARIPKFRRAHAHAPGGCREVA